MSDEIAVIRPNWPAPAHVRAASSTRPGGVSAAPWDTLNLGAHTGDDATRVAENRRRLKAALGLAVEPSWLEQVHGTNVSRLDSPAPARVADAAVAFGPDRVCAVLTADCLPVLFCDRAGTRVGIAHAGWRGLAAGVLEATVGALECAPRELIAWLGPAIGPEAFEVGDEVRAAFVAHDAGADTAFERNVRGRWQADLYALAGRRLARAGVDAVYGAVVSTHADARRFFSHRRDGPCGRMANLIWLVAA
jgi:YfiH family protein